MSGNKRSVKIAKPSGKQKPFQMVYNSIYDDSLCLVYFYITADPLLTYANFVSLAILVSRISRNLNLIIQISKNLTIHSYSKIQFTRIF